MPPKARITREMILNTALDITRQTGFETVNARGVAGRLQCSTRPIFTCYENMEELKQRVSGLRLRVSIASMWTISVNPRKSVPDFVLPRLVHRVCPGGDAAVQAAVYQRHGSQHGGGQRTSTGKPTMKRGREDFAGAPSAWRRERAKVIFLDLFLYTHGIAVLTATKKVSLDKARARDMLANVVASLCGAGTVGREQPGGSVT